MFFCLSPTKSIYLAVKFLNGLKNNYKSSFENIFLTMYFTTIITRTQLIKFYHNVRPFYIISLSLFKALKTFTIH